MEFDLPEQVLEVLPSDPFEQLDVARKITSIALSTRISALESETAALRRQLSERDGVISDLHSQLDSLDSSLADASDKLSRAEEAKESLVKENAMLSNTVKKLSRDVAKLEAFRKTLMKSLNDEEDNPAGTPDFAKNGQNRSEEPPRQTQSTESGHSYSEDAESETSRPRISPGLLLASQTSTPRLTPPGSPPSFSASVSPSRSPRPLSPRRHSISFSTARGMFDDRSSVFSTTSSHHGSMSGLETGSQTARTRVDGKEFFRQVSESTCNDVEEESDEEFFKIGHKLLFCASSISLTSQELRSLSMGEDHMDEDSTREVIVEDKVCEESMREASEDQVESETTTSKPSTSDSEGWQGFIKRLKKGPSIQLHTFHPSMPSLPSLPSIKMLSKRKSRSARRSMPMLPAPNLDADLQYCFEANWKNFSLSELQQATNNFKSENLIGEGGYSEVYKGHLKDGQPVAVKRLTRGTQEEMTADYLSELGILVHVKHPNIANVIGYGVDGGMHLVLPLSPHGSLANMLSGDRGKLTWRIRYNIAQGAAAGLAYLHEGCQRRIIHRDIKAANILLTEDLEAQISDFGLAKWLPDKWTHLTVLQIEGTFGYLPPEFFMHGIVDEKTDVYAFGVLLLELISGRPALDEARNSVVMWAKPRLLSKRNSEIVDPSLGDAYNSDQLDQILMVVSLCIQQSSTDRPSMSQVERMLISDDGKLQNNKKFKRWPPLKRRCAIELDSLLESP